LRNETAKAFTVARNATWRQQNGRSGIGMAQSELTVNLPMEFPEPYHSLPIRRWREQMKAHPDSYATAGVRAWLRSRHKWHLICRPDKLVYRLPDKSDQRGE
jgi:hypothetical protein